MIGIKSKECLLKAKILPSLEIISNKLELQPYPKESLIARKYAKIITINK